MGKYINPANETKEAFLERVGTKKSLFQAELIRDQGMNEPDAILCCIVDNGPFTAAIICDTQSEVEYVVDGFTTGSDNRPFQFYTVPKTELVEYL